jgi:hypothetical protein
MLIALPSALVEIIGKGLTIPWYVMELIIALHPYC